MGKMVRRRMKEVLNQKENMVRKNQIKTGKFKKESITPPSVVRIINKSSVEKLLILVPVRFCKVKTRYDKSKKIVNSLVKVCNSTSQYNSAKNNTNPNWMIYLAILSFR